MSYETVDSSGDYYSEDMMYSYGDPIEEVTDAPTPSNDAEQFIADTPQDDEYEQEIDSDIEEIDVNPYDPDYFKEPDAFADDQSKLEWYKDRVDTIQQLLSGESELYKSYIAERQNELVQKMESEFEGFGIMHQALQTDARGFLLQFIPEALAEHGINPIMSEEELLERVANDLSKEFGDDYRLRLNQSEMFDPRSFTAQVWARQQSLIREWDTINARNREILTKWNEAIASKPQQQQGMAQQATPQDLNNMYEQHFKDRYDRQSFDALMAEAQQTQFKVTDIEKILRYDQHIQEAYQRGLREAQGRGNAQFQQASREGTVVSARDVKPIRQEGNTPASIGYDFESFFNGGIPHY